MKKLLSKLVVSFVSGVVKKFPLEFLEELGRTILWRKGFGYSEGGLESEVGGVVGLLGPRLTPGGVVLDIGANVGNWSERFALLSPDTVIRAFEPSSTAFEELRQRFASRKNIYCHNVAVNRSSGHGQLFSDRAGSGLGSLTKRRLSHLGIEFSEVEKIKMVTLDSFCEEMALSPIAMKIDVEGHELDVLAGAHRTLGGIQVIQFEFGGANIDTRTFFQDFFYLLTPLGFKF